MRKEKCMLAKNDYQKETKNIVPPPRVFKIAVLDTLWRWLCWVTNNEFHPKHEVEFDIAFFIINTICLIFGLWWFIKTKEYAWIAVLVIEYNWAMDNMRHNREYLK
jgi:hypothetical protein